MLKCFLAVYRPTLSLAIEISKAFTTSKDKAPDFDLTNSLALFQPCILSTAYCVANRISPEQADHAKKYRTPLILSILISAGIEPRLIAFRPSCSMNVWKRDESKYLIA